MISRAQRLTAASAIALAAALVSLVLQNGRRHVPALPASGDVDVNTIPTDLIQRVDALTGGASAIYGADGVSGVLNFIMCTVPVRGQ